MRKFAIITDTGSDLPDSYYSAHDLEEVPLGYTMDGVTYGGEDGQKLETKAFYEKLRAGSMPKTFQATPEQVRKHFEAHAARGENVLAISFSSGLSGTCNSYRIAAREIAEQYPQAEIAVVDSLCASLGQGLLVDYVVKKADTGASLAETARYAESLIHSICHIFTVEDLFHLHRGGRVSAATAVVGSMLKIKPILHVDDEGHLIAIGKAMGRKKSVSALVERMKELETLGPEDPIWISHGDCPQDVEFVKTLLEREFGPREIFVGEIGPVIGTHSGAGTLALFFKGKHR